MLSPLREWLRAHGETIASFVKRSGVPERSLYRYIDGGRQAPLHHAVAIERATDGEVPASAFVKIKSHDTVAMDPEGASPTLAEAE